jgi:GTP-binding protein HflX
MPRTDSLFTTTALPPRAFTFAVQSQTDSDDDVATSLAELRQLLQGLGIRVDDSLVQRRNDSSGVNVIGAGKLRELKARLGGTPDDVSPEQPPWLVVFDGELSPGQQRFLASELEAEVVDRTQVILSVFQRRAQTRIAQLEIELARLQYEAPRIRDDESLLASQDGGGGRGGKGHTGAELRKRQLRRRMSALRSELELTQRAQHTRRARREQVARVALVGYTNAGKSSWMRALTGSDVQVENALFATLDTTVRALQPPSSPRIVVADTVGFLRNLPNHLLASFRSTLDEALDADLALFVVDAADDEWNAQLAVTRQVLSDVGADQTPSLILFNKCDRLSPDERSLLSAALPEAAQVSSRDPSDVERVRNAIIEAIDAQLQPAALRVPYKDGELRSLIHREAHVLSEQCDESGIELQIRARPELIAAWEKRLQAAPLSS